MLQVCKHPLFILATTLVSEIPASAEEGKLSTPSPISAGAASFLFI